ncbi:tripartite tricarboxylate transporter substrate binding protein [Paracidovorax konjaci]|uniref:Tripartite-type tricarboxylate transporter, receptor component TctC n=1 Tax=Paracidovorax konjaci TaxID=32040 RepID=A0A1I1UMI2_9BURK|nr:tripartite tricarboxylate transporter substrate binding protein [Paracidovorax konjaci]SFD71959.1 Tripartite-type tricarboxylate transporter, receptor component TctC [Paracidovorax konjaci]
MTAPNIPSRRALLQWAAAWAALGTGVPARAAVGDARTLRLVLPLAPGGAMDVLGRGLANGLGQRLGASVVVENRAGAGGNLAHELVAGEKPDGQTLLLTSNALVANVTLFEGRVRYDPVRSFAPVSIVASSPTVIVVRSDAPAREMAALATRARSTGISVGTPGFGNGNHLALVKLQRAQGGDWRHIPYKGAGPALVGLLGGETDAAIVALPAAQAHLQAGRLRALAVVQERRTSLAPEVPTLAEAGITIELDNGWFGLLAPAGTPAAVVERVHQAVTAALADPDFRMQLVRQGFEPVGSSSQAFAQQLDRDVASFPPLLKSIGARVE